MKKLLLIVLTTAILTIGRTTPLELIQASFSHAGIAIQTVRIDANTRVSSIGKAGEVIKRLNLKAGSPGIVADEYGNTYYVDIKTNGQDTRLILTAEPENNAEAVYEKIASAFDNVYVSAKGETLSDDKNAVNALLMRGCGGTAREKCEGGVTSFSGYTPAYPGLPMHMNVQTAVVDKGDIREVLLGFPYIVFEY